MAQNHYSALYTSKSLAISELKKDKACIVILWEKQSKNRNRALRQGSHILQQIHWFYQQDALVSLPAEELKHYLKKK